MLLDPGNRREIQVFVERVKFTVIDMHRNANRHSELGPGWRLATTTRVTYTSTMVQRRAAGLVRGDGFNSKTDIRQIDPRVLVLREDGFRGHLTLRVRERADGDIDGIGKSPRLPEDFGSARAATI